MLDHHQPRRRPVYRVPIKKDLDETSEAKDHEAFLTPAQVASKDATEDKISKHLLATVHSKKPIRKRLIDRFKNLSKKKKILLGCVIVLVLASGTVGAYALLQKPALKPVVPHIAKITKPITIVKPSSTVASTLTGLQVAPSVNQGPVTGVMIENSTFARPQSGLAEAGVVFEAVAEGGITRFLALYQDNGPSYVGPIRSARPYYLQWDLGFDAPLAHVGGSPDALADITAWGVKDLNEFYNGSSYTRITSREAPHNVYTSIATLNALEQSKGYTTSTFTGFPRKADSPLKTPIATSIDFNLSGSDYNVHYDYNSVGNDYTRSEGGQVQTDIDQNGNSVDVTPKVVIAIVVPESQGALDASDAYYTIYQDIGSGQAYIFQDGTTTICNWQKTSNTSQLTFTTAQGSPVKLNAGQTWITAVGSSSDIGYTT